MIKSGIEVSMAIIDANIFRIEHVFLSSTDRWPSPRATWAV
jgi:hypothetical protein